MMAPNGKVLLMNRTDGAGWAFPAATIGDGEVPEAAAWRAVFSRTGYRLGAVGRQLMTRVKGGTDCVTYICSIEDEFQPQLDGMHDAFRWMAPSDVIAATKSGASVVETDDEAFLRELEEPAPL
jgi:hypothetical protein